MPPFCLARISQTTHHTQSAPMRRPIQRSAQTRNRRNHHHTHSSPGCNEVCAIGVDIIHTTSQTYQGHQTRAGSRPRSGVYVHPTHTRTSQPMQDAAAKESKHAACNITPLCQHRWHAHTQRESRHIRHSNRAHSHCMDGGEPRRPTQDWRLSPAHSLAYGSLAAAAPPLLHSRREWLRQAAAGCGRAAATTCGCASS